MSQMMNSHHLRREEIEYELNIRGVPIEGNADNLRKLLSKCFSKNMTADEKIVAQLDPHKEIDFCEEKFSDLKKLVEKFEGDIGDNEYKRIKARLWHCYWRVERIPIPAASDTELEDRQKKALTELKNLIESFAESKGDLKKLESNEEERLEDEHSSVDSLEDNMDLPDKVQADLKQPTAHRPLMKLKSLPTIKTQNSAENKQSTDHRRFPDRPSTKMVPVYKWNIKFEGDGSQSVASFIQRAEELSRARGVSLQELHDSAVDLFGGAALIWYRSASQRIFSWAQLKEELKIVFQSADYDDRLQMEILNRTQGESESLDLFLAAIDGLFGRLSTPVTEEIKLQRIMRNLNPYLQDKLCMFTITSLEDLRHLGRKAEVGRLRASTLQPPPRPAGVLEPDLAWNSNRRKPVHGNVAYLNSNRDSTSPYQRTPRKLKCWNCGKENHSYRDCSEDFKVFCFGCGAAGIRKTDCPKCKPKNE